MSTTGTPGSMLESNRDGRLLRLVLNRPDKRNSMSPKLNRQMMRVLEEHEFRDDVGVLVLAGEGTAWTAGMDLKELWTITGHSSNN